MLKYIGKSLVIEDKIVVIGDLHLGYDGSLRKSGYSIHSNLYNDVITDMEKIISQLNKEVDTIVLLGDLKHEFGSILREEWTEVMNFIDFLKKRFDNIIVIKGNHDVIIEPILEKKGITVEKFYIYKDICFMHGDKEFEEINDKKIKYWIIGHAHPAITLHDGVKKEKYKCFLEGKYKNKEVVIVPSFFPINEGSDPRDYDLGLMWDFNLNNFSVKIISEDLEVIDFGLLKNLI